VTAEVNLVASSITITITMAMFQDAEAPPPVLRHPAGDRGWSTTALLAVAVATLAGCGPSHGVVPVEGRVTFAGGPPPSPGYVFFVPIDAPPTANERDMGPRQGTALFQQDGTFQATTFRAGDGLRPGRYQARIECSPPRSDAVAHAAAENAVPKGFTPPEVIISAKGRRPQMIEIDVR
jgi:hypothetical protein